MAKNITEKYINEYKILLNKKGEDGFYRYLIAMGIKQSINNPHPEIDVLDLSDAFFLLNRRTGENLYAILGKIFRRAAHTLYRQFNKEKNNNLSKKFLHLV